MKKKQAPAARAWPKKGIENRKKKNVHQQNTQTLIFALFSKTFVF